jgi:hypothetical protein
MTTNEEQRKTKEVDLKYAGLATAAWVDDGGPPAAARPVVPAPPEAAALSAVPAAGAGDQATPLFAAGEAAQLRVRWDAIQGGFVDEPRHAVEQADILVAEAMKRLAEVFGDERKKLEGQWDRKEAVSTEDLRLALRRYRSFFGRLLAV